MRTQKRIIAGIELEEVRELFPRPHWRIKVCATGFVFPAGVFKSDTRENMWESVERTAMAIGAKRFAIDTLGCK